MSNGTLIQNETLTATIGTDVFPLDWNETTEGYHYTFTGDMNPPGLGSFSVQIDASAAIFATQVTSTSLTISEEPTSAIASWPTISTTIDWTQSVVLGFDYRDNYGRLIADATQKTITIDGVPDILQGTNGTYWFEFDNSFDLGHHVVVVNISKYGYEFAVNSSISFDIVEADTDISLEWNTTTIDYLGQIILTADYTYSGTGDSILVGSVEVNITIDGVTTINLIESGDYWTITLDGDFLDLGVHSVVVRSQASGYSYAERNETLTVEEVSTITSGYTWIPANLTIDTTESLELVVYYTYSGIDVPDTAWVNVTINSRVYNLTFSTDAWRVNISGSDIWIGEFDATISAWLYGYESRTFVTPGINVTLAANTFHVIWEPFSLIPTYTDIVNLTIVYVEDSEPILDATVLLYINGTVYDLTSSYNETDKMWHFSIDAATIDLGTWNVTVTANKTGYTDGYYTDFLTVIEVSTTLDILPPEDTIYYDETTTVDIYYQLADLSAVPGAVISFTLNSVEQTIGWNVTHWSALLDGANLGIGIHTFTVSVSAYGYVDQVDTLVITILQIPTSIITDADVTIFALEFVSLRFTLIDDRTSSVVLATFAEEDWSGFLSHNLLPNGTHVITIGGSDFHVGNYTLELTLGRLGYYNSTGAIDIEALPIPTEFVYYTSWSQYENETIVIEVQLFDTAHNIPVDWAVVTIELDGTLRTAVFDATNNTYSVSFWLSPSITPGTHNLYLYGEAEDCLDAFEVTEIEILPKSTYDISITVVEQIQTGSTLNVTIIAIEGSQPVSGIYVTINIIVHLGEDTQQIITEGVVTDGDGQAIIMLDVPSGATEIEISASFQGSLSEWPSETSTYIVDVVPAGTDTGTGTGTGTSPIIADPLTLTIIAGGISLPILALAFRRRRRSGGRITAPVSVSPAAPAVPTPTAAIGIQKRVRDEIISSEEGITRAELSRRLGPSASKIGAMVKDLLNSDTGFYEVREGSKKLIKFRK